MSSVINDPLARVWLDHLVGTPCFASLHYEAPSPDDPASSEVDGVTYSRAILSWTYALNDTRSVVNLQDLSWLNLESTTIVCVGAWDAPTNGNLLLWAQLDEPIPVPDRGSYKVGAKELFCHV